MDLSSAMVRLPAQLDVASLAALERDVNVALASAAPVVVLRGATEETFCLGLALGSPHAGPVPAQAFSALLTGLHGADKPLIAVVDGRAIGGGMGLAAACDWLIATDRATFALPELLWGIAPAIIWPVLAQRMTQHALRQWVLSAHARPAAEALAAGLADEVVPPDGLDRALGRRLRMLRRLEPAALVELRSWSRRSSQLDLPAALARGAELTAARLQNATVRERWQAYLAGDSPWSS
ncbi:MAG TPA: enoyl-CoA hydratase/isomerase family protein [Steroidobacteraceae bacterium]|nr:enoyl-CoA hydratase/isomerase family protein [Steroidobacteraceae bacterium]